LDHEEAWNSSLKRGEKTGRRKTLRRYVSPKDKEEVVGGCSSLGVRLNLKEYGGYKGWLSRGVVAD